MTTKLMLAGMALLALTTTHGQAEERIVVNPTAVQRAQQKTESKLLKTLKTVTVPNFKVKDMQVDDAFKVLSQQYKHLSATGSGLNVLFKNTKPTTKRKLITVDLSSSSVPVTDVIYYICMNAGLNFRVDEYAVVVWERKSGEQLNRY